MPIAKALPDPTPNRACRVRSSIVVLSCTVLVDALSLMAERWMRPPGAKDHNLGGSPFASWSRANPAMSAILSRRSLHAPSFVHQEAGVFDRKTFSRQWKENKTRSRFVFPCGKLRCRSCDGPRRIVLHSTSRQHGARSPRSQRHDPDQIFIEFHSALQSSHGAIRRTPREIS